MPFDTLWGIGFQSLLNGYGADYMAFPGNSDVSKEVKNSRVGPKYQTKQSYGCDKNP